MPRPRRYRPHNSFEPLSEEMYRRQLHLSKTTVRHICEVLSHLAPRGSGGHPLPVDVKVTAALNFYASGSFQAPSGNLAGISQASVHRCVRQVTDALYARAGQFINFNVGRTQQKARALGFASIARIPNEQGAVDGTHIDLWAPHAGPQ